MKKHHRNETDCLNCGTELSGKYCHNCGQENLQLKESFRHMMTHAIADYFHFDHQFFHTLKPLLFQPGKLTNEYMAGKRVQYLHPVKMYIFISLLYFLLLFSVKENDEIVIKTDKAGAKKEEIEKATKAIETNKALNQDQKKKAIAAIGGIIVSKHKDGKTDTTFTAADDFLTTTKDTSYDQYLTKQKKLSPAQQDGFLKRYLNKKAIAWNQRGGTNSKEMIGEAVKHNTPKLMFFLLPMFALLLMVAFYKNKKYYVENLIFSFHLHCFIFLFLTLIMLLNRVIPENFAGFNNWIKFFAALAIPYYIYRALRAVFNRSPFRTVTKMIGLSLSYSMIFSISFLLLIILSAMLTI